MMNLRLLSAWACLSAAILAGPDAPARGQETLPQSGPAPRGGFVSEPAVTRSAGGAEISFALTAPNDVTVRIVDGAGKVVRHLACGMVGVEQAAKPFAPNRLSQKVAWDGKDDAGKAVPPAGCRAIIALATKAKFDKFILWNPDGFGSLGSPNWAAPGSIAVGPRGELHVVQQYGVHYSTLRLFDRAGRFLRCVWPLSMDKPRELLEPFLASTMTIWPSDVAAWGAQDYEGRQVPRSVRHSAFYWYGVKSVSMAVGPAGDVFLVDSFPNFTQILRIDGSGLPIKTPTCTPWVQKGSFLRNWSLAIGPEGDVYVADRSFGTVAHLDRTATKTVESFWYRGIEKLDKPTYLIGEPTAGQTGQYDPLLGLAVDKEGRIWLATPKEQCIKVFAKDGKALGTIRKVGLKDGEMELSNDGVSLAANLSSGAVYANCPGVKKGARRLVKLASWENPKAVAEAELPAVARAIAADGEGGLVWVVAGFDKLLRIKDCGETFETQVIDGLAGKTLTFPRLLTADAQGRLYVADSSSNYVQTDVDGNSFRRFSWYGVSGHGYCATDAEGNWYVPLSGRTGHEVWKLSPEGRRLDIGGKEALLIEDAKELKGVCVSSAGDIYVAVTGGAPEEVLKEVVGAVDAKGEKYNFSRVDVFGPDGVLRKKEIVRLQGVNDVKLDRDGCIYAIDAGTCHGAHKRRAAKLDNRKFSQFDGLLKFAPTGGVRDGRGHLWTYRGLSGTSSYTCAGECPAGQVCIDADNRVWVADAGMYNVAAVDSAGNLMFRVGAYGNEDCRGGGADRMIPGTRIVRDPEAPLTCPFGIAVWKDDSLMISDMYSHRILRCRLEPAQKKEVPLGP